MIVLIIVGVVIIIPILILILESYDRQKLKDLELERINTIKKYVIDGFNDVEEKAERFGSEYSESLIDFANKMDKMLSDEVRKNLKPYDMYNVKTLSNATLRSSRILGRIVIDVNLTPKFMVTPPSLDKDTADIELSVALTSSEVRDFADKCKRIFMDNEIEIFRKKEVDSLINGEKKV